MAPEAEPVSKSNRCFKLFQCYDEKVLSGDAQDFLLVIVTLIAAVTFQAGVNPPGGVWQEGGKAGKAIYAFQPGAFYVFLISNTVALCTSILVIISLVTHRKFPFQLEIVVATVAMLVTYASAIVAVTPHEFVRFRYVLTAGILPFIVRGLILLFRVCTRKDKEKTPANRSGDDNGRA